MARSKKLKSDAAHPAVGQLRLLWELLELVQDTGGVKAEANLSFDSPEAPFACFVASVVEAVVLDCCSLGSLLSWKTISYLVKRPELLVNVTNFSALKILHRWHSCYQLSITLIADILLARKTIEKSES